MWKAVDDLLARSIAEGIFPGCAMAAGQGTRVLFTSVHGTLAQGDARGVTHTTRYDVGLLTEVMATVPLLLMLLSSETMPKTSSLFSFCWVMETLPEFSMSTFQP